MAGILRSAAAALSLSCRSPLSAQSCRIDCHERVSACAVQKAPTVGEAADECHSLARPVCAQASDADTCSGHHLEVAAGPQGPSNKPTKYVDSSATVVPVGNDALLLCHLANRARAGLTMLH